MAYMMLICSDGVATEEKAATMSSHLPAYVERVKASGAYRYGHRLANASEARTVTVRDGQVTVSDGPFAESKEFVAGFDLFACDDRSEVAALAAEHPVSWFHCIEVRRLDDGHGDSGADVPPALAAGPPAGCQRFAIFICVDGIALSDAEEEQIGRDCGAWGERVRAAGISPFGSPLHGPDTAVTVRVRDGKTVLSDGPFVESKEFLAGLVVVDLPGLEDAVALAAEHPIAALHRLEVRPFHRD